MSSSSEEKTNVIAKKEETDKMTFASEQLVSAVLAEKNDHVDDAVDKAVEDAVAALTTKICEEKTRIKSTSSVAEETDTASAAAAAAEPAPSSDEKHEDNEETEAIRQYNEAKKANNELTKILTEMLEKPAEEKQIESHKEEEKQPQPEQEQNVEEVLLTEMELAEKDKANNNENESSRIEPKAEEKVLNENQNEIIKGI